MVCVIMVKFLSEVPISPNEFFAYMKPIWSSVENSSRNTNINAGIISSKRTNPKSVICIANCDSVEQLSREIAIMPGAGVESIEILPLLENQSVLNN